MIQEAVAYAEEKGVIINIENHWSGRHHASK
jgi:hypothetical protein